MLTLATSGEGAVLDDNTATINAMLADYNAGIPTPRGSAESAGFCNIAAPLGAVPSRSAPAWLALALGALLARTRASARRSA